MDELLESITQKNDELYFLFAYAKIKVSASQKNYLLIIFISTRRLSVRSTLFCSG